MTTPPENDFAELWTQAIEQHLHDMPDTELQALIARARGVGFNQPDPADRQRNILASIAAKQAKRVPVDANGHPVKGPPQQQVSTDPAYLSKLKGYTQP